MLMRVKQLLPGLLCKHILVHVLAFIFDLHGLVIGKDSDIIVGAPGSTGHYIGH